MIRDLSSLTEREFDVLVIGGGIYGLTIAYDAAQRGLSVALVERDDFGSATSFNHLRTIHGGLRYLQSLDLRRMRESVVERRTFARIAPRFVTPLAFALPTHASLTRNPVAMSAALAIDAVFASDRNAGVDPSRRLPAGRVIGGEECRALFEGAIPSASSAAVWYDYAIVNADRLTLAFAKAAAQHGAVLANYTTATAISADGTRVRGVTARDNLTGQTLQISARSIVNAAGPWAAGLLNGIGLSIRWPLLKAMNLITARPPHNTALVAPTRGGRALVLLPSGGRMLIGTSESAAEQGPDDHYAREDEIDAFVSEVNETFPSLQLKADEVTLVHRGIVPAQSRNGRLSLLGHSRIIDHTQSGLPNLFSIVGVKYTTARAVAERAVDQLVVKLRHARAPCRTAKVTLPGAGLDEREPGDPVAHAVREEMAQTLADVVIRRTGWGAMGPPEDALVQHAAKRMQLELGWSDDRTRCEIEALKRFYEVK